MCAFLSIIGVFACRLMHSLLEIINKKKYMLCDVKSGMSNKTKQIS